MPLTPTQKRALQFLEETAFDKPMSCRRFAELMWPKSNMHTSSKNTGNGATRGKAAWLCAGSYLGKLMKKDWVSNHTYSKSYYGYFLTSVGRKALKESKEKEIN